MPVLESYRGRDIIGVEELAGIANSLVEHYGAGGTAARGKAAGLAITPRMVRHYLSESLLGEPTGQTGVSTVFNYGNLLRLLAVKKLLADHWSVIKIKEFMRQLNITALEEFVNAALSSARLLPDAGKAAGEKEQAKPLRRATEDLSTDDEADASNNAAAAPSSLFAVDAARRREREVANWIEIAPGLEIKVRRSFRPPATEEDRARLAVRFWSVVMKEEE